MPVDLTLHQTTASGALVPSTLSRALALLAKLAGPRAPKATMHGHSLHVVVGLPIDDAASTAFLLDFMAQGQRVRGVAHGPSAAALVWGFHALARALKCTLHDAELERDVPPDPDAHREAAQAYLGSYESDVRTYRHKRVFEDMDEGAAFLAWLAREEHIEPAGDAAALSELAAALPLGDPAALYETILDSDAIADVFVSERELTSLLGRFRAR
jgi:hypothetical protein